MNLIYFLGLCQQYSHQIWRQCMWLNSVHIQFTLFKFLFHFLNVSEQSWQEHKYQNCLHIHYIQGIKWRWTIFTWHNFREPFCWGITSWYHFVLMFDLFLISLHILPFLLHFPLPFFLLFPIPSHLHFFLPVLLLTLTICFFLSFPLSPLSLSVLSPFIFILPSLFHHLHLHCLLPTFFV